MNPIRTTDPVAEPVSLSEAKAHLRIDHVDEDTAISMLIVMAREFAEDYTRLAFISQSWRWALDNWPDSITPNDFSVPRLSAAPPKRYVRLLRGPLLSVTSIITYDSNDVGTTWDAGEYFVATGEDRIYRRTSGTWPMPERRARGIEIDYVAGFGVLASDLPAPIRHAVMMLVAHYYENREIVAQTAGTTLLPLGVRALLDPYKSRKL
jgi:Phage gp6-like head-tail connector protein